MSSPWGPIDPAPRLAILELLPLSPSSMTTGEVTKALGKGSGTIEQMLHALKMDRLVDCQMNGRRRQWWRTEMPIPEVFTSTAGVQAIKRFTDTALLEALGVPSPSEQAVKAIRGRVVRMGDRR